MGYIFRFVLFSLIVYFILKFVGKFLRFFLGTKIRNAAEQARNTHQSQYRESHGQKVDGQVNIDYIPGQNDPKKNIKGGEYIDFEEID